MVIESEYLLIVDVCFVPKPYGNCK